MGMVARLLKDFDRKKVVLMMQRNFIPCLLALSLVPVLSGCATGGAVQPDRSVFSLDGNYQRYDYAFPIEETFDRTVKVFKEAGYRLDVADRATGQISGERSKVGDTTSSTDKGLKFYALVLPTSSGQSQVAVKIVQIIKQGSIVGGAKTEIIVSDAQMYQYTFHRIADLDFGNTGAASPYGPTAQPSAPAWNSPKSSPQP